MERSRPLPEVAILSRLVGARSSRLSEAAAKAILALTFDARDKARMLELNVTAGQRRLSRQELAEVDAYSRVDSLLGILKSKARRAIKGHRAGNGRPKPR